ncbi:MAG: diheme cytochrome c [Deltaproteobacteria bacterium]|nr:diheme cytochrome c [Deltaproteobacteria bacterium]
MSTKYNTKWTRKLMVPALLLVCAASIFLGSGVLLADDDDDEHERRERSGYRKTDKPGQGDWFVFRRSDVRPVDNELYAKECGACHFAYQPGLLPAGSWDRIMAGLSDHFGDNATLDPETTALLRLYLIDNSAESSTAKVSYKIVRSLAGEKPLRITDVPWIKREHNEEITPRTLERLKIKTLANCQVCHRDAAKGVYDDD